VERGNISNRQAPGLLFDVHVILKVREQGLIDKIKKVIGRPEYELRSKYIGEYFEKFFRMDYAVYIMNHNDTKVTVNTLSALGLYCFKGVVVPYDELDLRKICNDLNIEYSFLMPSPTFSIGVAGPSAKPFVSWAEVWRVIRSDI